MVRSASAFLAVLILSGFAAVQQVATHTVVPGDTLWDLAQQYYQNPFDWRRIWEANRDRVGDPNLIFPGWVLAIPGREAAVGDVIVNAPDARGVAPANPGSPPQPQTAQQQLPMKDQPTIFRQDTSLVRGSVVRGEAALYNPVPQGLVWAAPWVERIGQSVEPMGQLDAFAGGASMSETARTYDRLRVSFTGAVPAVGTRLQTYRREKSIENVGEVMRPTGTVDVAEVTGDSAIVVVSHEYARMTMGDFLRPLPEYSVKLGDSAAPVEGGPRAMVMGFAGLNVLQDVGGVAFLDQGADDGVNIGDEYEYLNPTAGAGVVEGRVQVIGTTASMAAARILSMDDAVFHEGVVVRLARKMR